MSEIITVPFIHAVYGILPRHRKDSLCLFNDVMDAVITEREQVFPYCTIRMDPSVDYSSYPIKYLGVFFQEEDDNALKIVTDEHGTPFILMETGGYSLLEKLFTDTFADERRWQENPYQQFTLPGMAFAQKKLGFESDISEFREVTHDAGAENKKIVQDFLDKSFLYQGALCIPCPAGLTISSPPLKVSGLLVEKHVLTHMDRSIKENNNKIFINELPLNTVNLLVQNEVDEYNAKYTVEFHDNPFMKTDVNSSLKEIFPDLIIQRMPLSEMTRDVFFAFETFKEICLNFHDEMFPVFDAACATLVEAIKNTETYNRIEKENGGRLFVYYDNERIEDIARQIESLSKYCQFAIRANYLQEHDAKQLNFATKCHDKTPTLS